MQNHQSSPEIHAFSDWSTSLANGKRETIQVFASPEHFPLVSAIPSSALNSAKLGIVPVGRAGEVLWGNIPRKVASIVGRVRAECLIIVPPARSEENLPGATIWDALDNLSDSDVEVLDGIASPVTSDNLPLLAPRTRPLSPETGCLIDIQGDQECEGIALRAGLTLIHDDLNGSHELSQSIEGMGNPLLGDYWHAIMHRREPDYFNAKYWFRRLGRHPLFPAIAEEANSLLSDPAIPQGAVWKKRLLARGWDAAAFVDLCEVCSADESGGLGLIARKIQWFEMLCLLRLCCPPVSRS
jgi:hypothetical protein